MALLAPFLISHGLLDPNAQLVGSQRPAAGRIPTAHAELAEPVRHRSGGPVGARPVRLERPNLAGRGPLAAVGSTVVGAGIGIIAGFYGAGR